MKPNKNVTAITMALVNCLNAIRITSKLTNMTKVSSVQTHSYVCDDDQSMLCAQSCTQALKQAHLDVVVILV